MLLSLFVDVQEHITSTQLIYVHILGENISIFKYIQECLDY